MDPRLARGLTALYPRKWRTRYGDEFTAFLEDQPSTIRGLVNTLAWALRERAGATGDFDMDARQRCLASMSYAYLAAVAAGVNFYWTVDDTALAAAMDSHPALFICFRAVAIGSFVAFGAVVAIAVPVVLSMMRTAIRSHRWDVVSRVAFPFVAAALTIAWMVAAGTWAHLRWGGPWVPTPWDVGGDWTAPPGWPPLTMRFALSSVTFVLLVSGLVGSAISVAQAIHRSNLSEHHPLLFRATSLALAASITTMAVGITAWGWVAERDVSIAFHSGDGGLFSLATVASWLASTAVFIAASIIALGGARSANASSSE